MPCFRDLPDWRDARAYEFLLQAERTCFAWEWLRRQADYRAAALQSGVRQIRLPLDALPEQVRAGRWGLHVFEDPRLTAEQARPIWRSDRHSFVLCACAHPSGENDDDFQLDAVRQFAMVAVSPGVEHLLLSDGCRSIRIDVRGASLLRGPVRLKYQLQGIAAAKTPLLVLQRFLALASNGEFSRSLHPPHSRARRQILLLRTWDALREGADQRTIAAELLSGRAADTRWRVSSPSLRSQAQRLVRGAETMAGGGFWNLLM